MKEGDWQQKYRIFQLKSREIWWVGFKRAFEDFIKGMFRNFFLTPPTYSRFFQILATV